MKVYFAGSISSGRDKVYDYNKVIEELSYLRFDVLTKHVGDVNLTSTGENIEAFELFKRDTNWLEECDFVFADVSIASLGVGFELGYATLLNKKIIAIYDEKYDVSKFIKGNNKINFYSYNKIDEIISNINNILDKEFV